MKHRYVRRFVRCLKKDGRQKISEKGFLCESDDAANKIFRALLKKDASVHEAVLIRARGGRQEIAESIAYC